MTERFAPATSEKASVSLSTTADGVSLYGWNALGQQISYTGNGHTASYTYGVDGIRTSKTVDGQPTQLVNVSGSVVAELGSQTTAYYRANGKILYAKTGTTIANYTYNGHGDVIKAGAQTYTYDAFGNQRNPSDNDTNPFRYCGEYWDGESGQIYLRARYYDPGIGRFTASDPARDGANWYVYCGGNTVMWVDPSGMIPTVEEAAAMAEHIYGDYDMSPEGKTSRTVEGWRLITVWYGRESMKMGIYIPEGDDWQNPSEYAIVFRGTTAWFDDGGISNEAWNNVEAGISGKSANIWDAMNYSKDFIDSHSGKEVTFVGHSKGGGEAIAAADYMDSNAITFNAANYNFRVYVLGIGKGEINNYYVKGEILESTLGPATIGTTHWLPTQYAPGLNRSDNLWTRTRKIVKAAIANHHMAAVQQALK